jgi:MerR HTH family regulatory protein
MARKRRKARKVLDGATQLATISSAMQQTRSTEEVAQEIGVHYVTIRKWLAAGLIRPTVAVPFGSRTLWRWTADDIEQARRVKAKQRPGRKPRAGA